MNQNSARDITYRSGGIFLGAAVGDALGWPQEQRSGIVGGKSAREVDPEPRFRAWKRYTGSQFLKYVENVTPGTYSDDTQLLCAVARSNLSDDWYSWLTKLELPFWLNYQRGGGGATIRAARAWSSGQPPWSQADQPKNAKRNHRLAYFQAGGNGVAMRIAPHAVATIYDKPDELVARVVKDGITTHGHPRALVGAAVFAIAVRHLILQEGTLQYGDLLNSVIHEPSWQEGGTAFRDVPSEWLLAYEEQLNESASNAWAGVVREVSALLEIGNRSLAQGSLADDHETLNELGCFDKARNGSGTITAAASLYLSARYAANPMSGVVRAAFLRNADTDTLASMVGCLMGALHGIDWMEKLAPSVQDYRYIWSLSLRCSRTTQGTLEQIPWSEQTSRPTSRDLEVWRRRVTSGELTSGRLPDGREFTVVKLTNLEGRTSALTRRATINIEGGQTIFVDRSERSTDSNEEDALIKEVRQNAILSSTATTSVSHISLIVRDLKRSKHLYSEVLGLKIEDLPSGEVVVSDYFHLRPSSIEDVNKLTPPVLITIKSTDFDQTVESIRKSDIAVHVIWDTRQKRKICRFKDFDGYDVVIQSR